MRANGDQNRWLHVFQTYFFQILFLIKNVNSNRFCLGFGLDTAFPSSLRYPPLRLLNNFVNVVSMNLTHVMHSLDDSNKETSLTIGDILSRRILR
jgi:hypothetical protein